MVLGQVLICISGLGSVGCWIVVFFASGVCPLVGEAGLEACSGLLVGGAMSWPPAGKQRQNTL